MSTLTRKEQWYGGKAITDRFRKVDERYDSNEVNRLCCISAVLTEIRYVPGTEIDDFRALSAEQRLEYINANDTVRLMNCDDLIDLLAMCLYGGKKEPAVAFIERTMDLLEGKKTSIVTDKGINAVELSNMQFEPVKWFVKDLIPEGLTVIAGQSKIGKSWFLLQLGLCVSHGGMFIGGWQCNQCGVLYMSLEDNKRRAKFRLDTIPIPKNKNLYYKDEWDTGVAGVDHYLTKYPDIKVVMIDTWGRFSANLLENNNDYQQVTRLAGELHTVAKKHEASLIICTHTNKDSKRADWLDDVMGSKALVGAADTILKLSRKRGESDGTLDTTGRDVWERTLELTCASDWLWLDTNPPAHVKQLSEFETYSGSDKVPF